MKETVEERLAKVPICPVQAHVEEVSAYTKVESRAPLKVSTNAGVNDRPSAYVSRFFFGAGLKVFKFEFLCMINAFQRRHMTLHWKHTETFLLSKKGNLCEFH